ADGGRIDNQSSTIAAGGDLVRRADGGSISDTGTVLQQRVSQDTAAIYYWHQKTGGDNDTTHPREDGQYDGISQTTTTVDALPALATSNRSVQTDAQDIRISSVARQGQTVAGSGVTGSDQPGRPQTAGLA